MPFQISLSIYNQPLGVIYSFNAGPDQTITCDPGNTLNATVVGSLVGHTILWAQIAGPGASSFVPVTWTTPLNQLSVSYLQNEDSDKFFAFYIDYGTPRQQVSTVANYNTPIAIEYFTSNLASANFTKAAEGQNFARTLIGGSTLLLVPYGTQNGVANSPPTDYQLSALISTDANLISYITVQENTGTGWTTLTTLPGTNIINGSFTYGPVTVGPSYRLLLGFNGYQYQRGTPAVEASQAVYASSSTLQIAGMSQFTAPDTIQSRSYVSAITTSIPTLKSFGPTPPQDIFYNSGSLQSKTLISAITTFIPTLKSFGPNPPQDIFYNSGSLTSRPAMSAYSYTIPGGSHVGG